MKKLFILLIAFCYLSTNAQTSKDVFPYKIVQEKLSNGLSVATIPYNSPGIVSFYLVVRVGSREEVEPGKSGFAHFFEHMMFRGTEKYPKDKYSEVLKGIGASANANTWWDRTVYHMTGNSGELEKMFELESDRFQNLKYSEADFKVEAGAVKGEYIKNFSSPIQKLSEKVNDVAYSEHTYKHTTIGFWKDVVDMPNQYQYSLEFFKRFYRPEYTTLLIVGDVKPEKVLELAKKYFGDWKKGDYKASIPAEQKQTETRYAHIQGANYPPTLNMNYKGPAFSISQKDKAALDLLAALGFSEKSEIYKKLVVDEQRARNIYAGGEDLRDPALFKFGATVKSADDLAYIKEEIEKVIEKAKKEPFDEKQLREAKSRMRYSFAMGIDSPSNIAESLAEITWLTGNPSDINALYNLYDSINASDIMEAAKKYLVKENLTIGTVSPADQSPFIK